MGGLMPKSTTKIVNIYKEAKLFPSLGGLEAKIVESENWFKEKVEWLEATPKEIAYFRRMAVKGIFFWMCKLWFGYSKLLLPLAFFLFKK